jgi:hypothetical protein
MQYFDESDNKLERIGKVIGDIISAIIIVGFMAIFVYSLITRWDGNVRPIGRSRRLLCRGPRAGALWIVAN